MDPIELRDKLRNERIEKFFYLTLIITVLHGGFVLWDLFCLIIHKVNDVFSSGAFSNIYLVALGGYAGYKEFVRWMENPADSDEEAAKEKILRFQRGEIIVTAWLFLYLGCLAIERLHMISRLPMELERTALQVFAVVVGTYGSKSLLIGRARKQVRSAGNGDKGYPGDSLKTVPSVKLTNEEIEAKVLELAVKNGRISNNEVRNLAGVDRFRAFDILEVLTKKGKLTKSGDAKGTMYLIVP